MTNMVTTRAATHLLAAAREPGVFTDARRDLQPGAFPPWPQAGASRPR